MVGWRDGGQVRPIALLAMMTVNTASCTLKLTVTMIANNGSYGAAWWWYTARQRYEAVVRSDHPLAGEEPRPRLERRLVLTGPTGRPWHPNVTAIRDLCEKHTAGVSSPAASLR
ncbi:hypothetical protein ACWEPL_16295 [Nonomuraea sp. NPDC004186]